KLAFCVMAAYTLSQNLKTRGYGKDLLIPVIFPFGAVLVLLILLGKDIGTVLIMMAIIAVVLYLGGVRTVYLLITAAIGLIGLIVMTMQSGNRMMRIDAGRGNCDHPPTPCTKSNQEIFRLPPAGGFVSGLGRSVQNGPI